MGVAAQFLCGYSMVTLWLLCKNGITTSALCQYNKSLFIVYSNVAVSSTTAHCNALPLKLKLMQYCNAVVRVETQIWTTATTNQCSRL